MSKDKDIKKGKLVVERLETCDLDELKHLINKEGRNPKVLEAILEKLGYSYSDSKSGSGRNFKNTFVQTPISIHFPHGRKGLFGKKEINEIGRKVCKHIQYSRSKISS